MMAEVPVQGGVDASSASASASRDGRFDVDPLDLLARAGERLGASLDTGETLTDVARLLVPELADWCAIDVLDGDDPSRHVAFIHAADSLGDAAEDVGRTYLLHGARHPHVARVLESRRAELHEDVADKVVDRIALDDHHRALLRTLGTRSVILAPLVARGRALGVLTMVAGYSGRSYTPRDLALVEELARRIGLAIDNAGLYAEANAVRAVAEASQRRVAFLADVSATLAASLDYRTTLQAVARLAVPILAECCTVAILQADGTVYRLAGAHVNPEKEALIRSLGDTIPHDPEGEHPAAIVLRTGETLVLDAMPDEQLVKMARDKAHLAMLRGMGYTAALVVPLVAHGRRLGTVTFAATNPERRFGPDEIELGEELARRAALAIDNAQLYLDAQRAAAALRQSEESFRLLFETNPLAMLVFDTSTLEVLEANAAAVEQYGYARSELLGRNISTIWMPEDVQRRVAFATSYRSPAYFNPAVSKHRGKGGRLLRVRVMSHRLRFAGREARLLTMQNVGEQLRAEERLRESDEHLKRALSAAQMATFDWDLRTSVIVRSPGHEALYGLPPGAMDGTREAFMERVHPEDREAVRMHFDDAPVEQTTHDDEFRVVWPDGTIRWLARRGTIFCDAAGRPIRMVGTTMDVTERRRAEEEAQRSNERLARILENISEGFYALDREWQFTYVNQQADAMMRQFNPDHRRERLIGARIEDVYADVHEPPFGTALRAAFDTGEPQHVVTSFGPDGQWWEFNVCPSDEGVSVFYRDVTERKRAEHEREQLLAERQREAERLRTLHRQLEQSVQALLGLHEVGQVLNATRDIDRMGARLLEIAQRAASLDAAAISRAPRRGGFRLWKRSGPEALWRAARRSAEARHARQVARSTGAAQGYAIPSQDDCRAGLRGWCVPLKQGERVIGLIEAFAAPRRASAATAEILGSMAHQLATAMQNARLYGELAASERALHELVGRLMRAQEEERRRLALEVHDGLAQVATSAQMHLEAFAHDFPPLTERARGKLDTAVSLTRQSVVEIRRVLGGLRPQLLDDYGLAHALAVYVQGLVEEGWDVTYREGLGDERLPEEVETALFRLAQEALANVRKHAETRQVRLELDREERSVCLAVRDWGRGFEPSAATANARPGERLGLLGMRERICLIGGQCEVTSRPGEGTRVVARVPIASTGSRGRASG